MSHVFGSEEKRWPAFLSLSLSLSFGLFPRSYRVKVAAEPELAQPRREQGLRDEAGLDAVDQV